MKKTKNTFFITVSFLVLIIIFSSFPCFGGRHSLEEKVSALGDSGGQDIVIYFGNDKGGVKETIKEFKSIKKDYSDHGIVVVDGSELPRVKDKKNKKEIVAYNYNQEYKTFLTPNDVYYPQQWALSKIGAPETWDKTTGSSEIVVAVLDTGFVLDHEDLAGRFVAGKDIIDNDDDPYLPLGGGTSYSHGTLVSGVIAGVANNGKGVVGLDWNVKIMPIRVMDNNGSGNTATVAAGINYAFSNGADIINMSLGGDSGDSVLESAINNAYGSGITLVAASGNDSRLGVSYPAKYQNVIAVGSSDSNDLRASTSNYGPELDVVAPGVSIMTTATSWNGSSYTTNQYGSASGTSLATPYVSALASLLLTQGVFSPEQIKDKITSSADKVSGMSGENRTDYYGYGRISSYSAVSNIETTVVDYSKITQITLRVSIGDYTTDDPSDYIFRFSSPAIGEEITLRGALKNENSYPVTISNVRFIGVYDNGIKFVAGTTPLLTLQPDVFTLIPNKSFRLTSFRAVYFYIDYKVEGKVYLPHIGPTYSPMKIYAHFPNVKVVSSPVFSPSRVAISEPITGIFKLKNYDDRPAYLRNIELRTCVSGLCWSFPKIVHELAPGEVYQYVQAYTPTRGGTYETKVRIIYGNGSLSNPHWVTGVTNMGYYEVK